ncbi:6-phosphogluconate dehydrogenase [Flavobacterium sp. F372]|uniref:6-phosphogluconate dehydrogenase n=1 Tax=Flavobacterium bernardetii TaxID=2813823 RepID=A0ABR7IUL4_9FLAO|nr:6-phosphogluconate dehydrogenase [Flavobacterium bernardetii]NHF68692.1 6-phosphogluconate dehydrogenase [Flavobacterium bernardetii]
MRKILVYGILAIVLAASAYIAALYYATFSDGIRTGELIKFSHKGYIFKTWEGELSQGLSGSQKFAFSVMDNQPEVIEQMKLNQGKFVKIEYIERYGTFSWWGETNYYITKVTPEKSPYFNVK